MTYPGREKIIVGMSGGVDSSVAALLLLERGASVEGLFMKNWDEDDGTEYCTAKADHDDAAEVAHRLGIKLHTANFAAEYWDNVFENFLAEYRAGRTPNPDILCNREIKFNVFVDYARSLGAPRIATGHYARAQRGSLTAFELRKSVDTGKDQTYFLNAVPLNQLSDACFRSAVEEARGSRNREARRSAQPPAKRQHRHLLHRRAPLPRLSGALRFVDSLDRSSASTAASMGAHRAAPLHDRSARRSGHRRPRKKARSAVVRRIERYEGEHTGGFAAPRDLDSDWLTTASINWLADPRATFAMHRKSEISPGGPAVHALTAAQTAGIGSTSHLRNAQ